MDEMEGSEMSLAESSGAELVGSVSVDNAKCEGHARCWSAAPEFYTLDAEGYSDIGRHKPFAADMEAAVLTGINNCPEAALSVDVD